MSICARLRRRPQQDRRHAHVRGSLGRPSARWWRRRPVPPISRPPSANATQALCAAAGVPEMSVATRSAGPASHPGQYESYLHIRGADEVVAGVQPGVVEHLQPAVAHRPGPAGPRRGLRPHRGGRPADGRRQGRRSDVHRQPGRRRHREDLHRVQLGPGGVCRGRRGHARLLPGGQGRSRRSSAAASARRRSGSLSTRPPASPAIRRSPRTRRRRPP